MIVSQRLNEIRLSVTQVVLLVTLNLVNDNNFFFLFEARHFAETVVVFGRSKPLVF